MRFVCDRCLAELPKTIYLEDKIAVPQKCRKFYMENGAPMFAFCEECASSFTEWFDNVLPHDYKPYYTNKKTLMEGIDLYIDEGFSVDTPEDKLHVKGFISKLMEMAST